MSLRGIALLVALSVAVLAGAQPKPATVPPGVAPAVARLLDAIREADRGQLAVSTEDGQFLRSGLSTIVSPGLEGISMTYKKR